MDKISFLAVANQILSKYQTVAIETTERWDKRSVIRFVVTKQYPLLQFVQKKGPSSDHEEMRKDRQACPGQVLLYYDTLEQRIIGCTSEINQMFKDLKNNHVEKIIKENILGSGV